MSSEIQRLTDQLARELNRPVAIDDKRLHLRCYSPHYGQVDQARIDSIMHRAASPDILAFIESLGVPKAVEPVRVPANAELGTCARVCVPVRNGGIVLGYLWIIDWEEDLAGEELRRAAEVAEQIGLLLHHDHLLGEIERGRERELLRDLLVGDSDLRKEAALSIAGTLAGPRHRWLALVARPAAVATPLTGLTAAFDTELEALRLRPGVALALHLVRSDHTILVVVQPETGPDCDVRTIARAYQKALRAALPDPAAGDIVIGAGDPQENGAGTVLSYEQAAMACRVADAVAGTGDIVLWSECGIYRTLLGLAPAALDRRLLDPAVRRLLDADPDGVLAGTMEHYLDSGARIKATAERLNLHRTTLYYRIDRTEQITGLDLSSGGDRLILHLGLKLARMAAPRRPGFSSPMAAATSW
ncbi:PucR family transcriptional regulator [Streptomyces sp. NPDC055078]